MSLSENILLGPRQPFPLSTKNDKAKSLSMENRKKRQNCSQRGEEENIITIKQECSKNEATKNWMRLEDEKNAKEAKGGRAEELWVYAACCVRRRSFLMDAINWRKRRVTTNCLGFSNISSVSHTTKEKFSLRVRDVPLCHDSTWSWTCA